MTRDRRPDTKARIQQVARDLFIRQGVQQTSLRQIAEELGITKPALYYHFKSRDDLVASIVRPIVDEIETFLTEREAAGPPDPRRLLEDYFDVLYRHREVTVMVTSELSTLAYLDLGTRMFDWRRRLITLLLGPDPSLTAQVRAVTAIGGMSDCTVHFAHVPFDELRPLAVDAAWDTLQGVLPTRP